MKIVLWIGNEANQKALANKIHEKFPLAGIVTETRQKKSTLTVKKIFVKLIERLFLGKIGKAWFGMMKYYEKRFPVYPAVPLLNTTNINDDKVFLFTTEKNPDLIVVSGTRLIREKLLSISPVLGIMNLHTGLSPYIKGGPNCTNWCIANKEFHLIGNTVMWIDKGIDTGNIITTECTNFTGDESLTELHIKVMEHAHSLYLKSITTASLKKIQNIPQREIAQGTTYFTKQWGLSEKFKLVKNYPLLKKAVKAGEVDQKRNDIKTFSLI